MEDTPLALPAPPAQYQVADPAASRAAAADAAARQAAGDIANRIKWIQEQIAEACIVPPEGSTVWSGREEILRACRKRFTITYAEAGEAMDAAVADLWNKGKPDTSEVMKRNMLVRFYQYRQLAFKYMKDGKSEKHLKYIPLGDIEERLQPAHLKGGDPSQLVGVLVREKQYSGIDMAAVNQLMKIEMCIAELEGLGGKSTDGNMNFVNAFFSELGERSKRQQEEEEKAELSPAQKAKLGKISNLDAEGRKKVLGTIIEAHGKSGKRGPGRPRKALPTIDVQAVQLPVAPEAPTGVEAK